MALPEALVARLRPHASQPLARPAEVERVEAAMGLVLPQPLVDLYLHVGNGGFGPGYGLLGLDGGARDDLGQTALNTYQSFMQPDPSAARSDGPWWDPAFLPICYWGCIVYTAVDCRTSDARVRGFDEGTWVDDDRSLADWLETWLTDPKMPQPVAAAPS